MLDTAAAYGLDAPLAISGATSAAPTAGTSVCSIAAPPVGRYRISVVTRQSGTPDRVNSEKNMNLRAGTTVLNQLSSTDVQGNWLTVEASLDGSTTVNVVTGSVNAGAGAVYRAAIVAVRIA